MRTRPLRIEGGLDALFAACAEQPHAFFLESSLPAGGLGRHSFFGFAPVAVFRVENGAASVAWNDGRSERLGGDPLDALRMLHERQGAKHARTAAGSDVTPFAGGAVGFFSYEFGLRFEGLSRSRADDIAVPEAVWAFYDVVVVREEMSGKIFLTTALADAAEAGRALDRFEHEVGVRLTESRAARVGRVVLNEPERRREQSDVEGADRVQPAGDVRHITSNFTRAGYEAAIARVKEYIRSGDVYQINLSQRFSAPLGCAPAELYRQLRRQSPAPYGCFLNFDGVQLVGVSPERFLRVDGDRVSTRPIKGTRPRGGDAREDARLKDELARSEKDRAELLMIVDLERNDLGRVCVPGSVRVSELYAIEPHPTVWHQVAEVSGTLRSGADVFDCIRAAFPGGSITGAPKIRAMQIIDELEPHRRHVYTGAIGYLGFDGRAELNIAIRTFTCVAGRAYFHAGGGVVWDSQPAAEYEETLTKAKALRAALAAVGTAGAAGKGEYEA
jgi:para-aminobenzoate synthetase component I